MNRMAVFCLLLFCLLIARPAGVSAQKKGAKEKKLRPMFTVGRETTFVTGPITSDGHIDYVTALNERLRDGVTPENNANVLLWQAFGPHDGDKMPADFFKWLNMAAPPEQGDYVVTDRRFADDHKLDEAEQIRFYDEIELAMERPWQALDHLEVGLWLKANDKPLAVAIEATQRTHYYAPVLPRGKRAVPHNLTFASVAGIQHYRELACALTARAMLKVSEGKPDDAWRDLLACHRLARLVGKGGTSIEALVSFAMDSIASTADLAFIDAARLDAKKLKRCLDDLQALPPMPPLADKISLCERFTFLDAVMLMDRHGVNALGVKLAPINLTGLVNWDPALRRGNQMYTRMAQVVRLKDRNLREKHLKEFDHAFETPEKELDVNELAMEFLAAGSIPAALGKIMGDRLIYRFLPVIKSQRYADRREQTQRNLHLAFALAIYKAEHGNYPKTLAALAPKYLPAIPDDIFSGKALIYRPRDDGYLLYSVGANGQDDDGRGFGDEPFGADDLPVRMPLPKLR